MKTKNGTITQEDFDKKNDELTRLKMELLFKDSKELKKRVEELENELKEYL